MEYTRHNPSFGCHYLAQKFMCISVFHKFSKISLHTNFKLSFRINQHIIVLRTGYSIKLKVNAFIFAFNVIRATCSATKIFTNCFCF
jgi:hypothetical protein